MTWLRFVTPFVLLGTIGAHARAADWPQWLGPQRDNRSPETVSPWHREPHVAWRLPVSEGHSSPIVADGKVFLHTKVKDREEEEVAAFDARTGEVLWRKAYSRPAFKSIFGNGPRATPLWAGGKLFTLGVTGILSCWEAADGKLLWRKDIQEEFHPPKLLFGVSCSPLLEGGGVLVNVGARQASLVAFDVSSGAVLWKSQDDKATYSSPIAFSAGGRRQVVFLTQEGLISVDPADGAPYWRYPLTDRLFESSATPARAGDMILASSITYGMVALRLLPGRNPPAVEKAWYDEGLTCYFSTPVAFKDYFFAVTGSKPFATKHEATLRCVEIATGKPLWQKEHVGTYHAALLRTGNDKLLLLDDAGNLALLEPNPSRYQELARSKVCGETWSHPALAEGRLYVRDKGELISLELPR